MWLPAGDAAIGALTFGGSPIGLNGNLNVSPAAGSTLGISGPVSQNGAPGTPGRGLSLSLVNSGTLILAGSDSRRTSSFSILLKNQKKRHRNVGIKLKGNMAISRVVISPAKIPTGVGEARTPRLTATTEIDDPQYIPHDKGLVRIGRPPEPSHHGCRDANGDVPPACRKCEDARQESSLLKNKEHDAYHSPRLRQVSTRRSKDETNCLMGQPPGSSTLSLGVKGP